MMFKRIYFWKSLLFLGALLGMSGGFFCLKKYAVSPRPVVLARIDLRKTLQKHPNWARYRELQGQIDKLRRKWNTKNPAALNNGANSDAANIAELYKQVDEIEQIYLDESRLKLSNLNNTIKEYAQNRTEQLTVILQERFESINNRLKSDLQNCSKENETKLQTYLNQLQKENQVALSNLQLQLSLLDLSGDPLKIKWEKARIQEEISRIKKEIEQKRSAREAAMQAELQTYATKQKETAAQEFAEFKAERETQVKEDIAAYRRRLENEYNEWKTKREQKLDSAKKIRQDQLEQEYRDDRARESLLKSQQEQLKEATIWEVRQKSKKIAFSHKVDCILTGEYLNISLPDLTGAVQKSLLIKKKMN
jgi:hypothetical protein